MITPVELAEKLGVLPPTAEQAAVVEAALAPMVVVAGAGSGKSETMAARVVWLVANGLVRPERVLGLTFTRKAAAELAVRVRKRLAKLAEVNLIDPAVLDGEPTISTYHAYASRLVADHALREALEPTLRLITPAVSWQLAARVVGQYDGPMDAVDLGPPSVTAAVLELAGEMSEHLRASGDVRDVGRWLAGAFDGLSGKTIQAQQKPLKVQNAREQLLPMVERYNAIKSDREVMDYGDQMALAARIASNHPEVGAIEKSRFSVVLLDEYQDTSHAQLVLLRALFGGGHPVTAVGDPCQSIYGWRGASAGNLRRFVTDFPDVSGQRAPVRQLSVSFRNGDRVLDAAARVQIQLRAEAAEVPVLVPGANRRDRGRVVCALHDTAAAEADWLADEVLSLLDPRSARPPQGRSAQDRPVSESRGSWDEEWPLWEDWDEELSDDEPGGVAPDGLPWEDGVRRAVQPNEIAILARKRAQFPALREALAVRGIPVEVVGLGGLLTVPEVADVVATLRVLHDATAGGPLARLLAGPRWRLGPRDLKALGDLARELNGPVRPDGEDQLEEALAEMREERGSLVDALDELNDRPDYLERFSEPGALRVKAFARELRTLRTHAAQPLPDLIHEIERQMGLDIEVAARGGGPVTARADLDAFIDAAARFAGDSEDPTLGAFLAYLKAAETEEFGLEAGRVGETNSVKLMTVHAAKGLEWPVVIVPGMSEMRSSKGSLVKGSMFPATPVTNARWTENPRKLPYMLRGDRSDLPALAGLTKDDLATFDELCRERDELEERRLAYVAVTRAHFLLIASGYRWGTASKPLQPSVFLSEITEVADDIAVWAPEPEEGVENPLLAEPATASWPVISAGERFDAVVSGAQMVAEAIDGTARASSPAAFAGLREWDRKRLGQWARDAELLLAERDRNRRTGGSVVELPGHLTVSSLVTLAADPAALARQIRRPVPRAPAPYARRGTAFHRWLEARWGQQRLIDDFELPGWADEPSPGDVALSELQGAFELSEWARREPYDIEVPFETMIGDRIIRGRMDAVFRVDASFEVVDWKTGARPRGKAAKSASVQLAAYRLAWAELAGVPVDSVRAAFHYVRTNETVRPADLLDEAGLLALIDSVPQVE